MKYEATPNELESQMLIELLEGYGDMYAESQSAGEIEFARKTSEGSFWGRANFQNGRLESLVFVPPVTPGMLDTRLCWYKIRNIPEYGLFCSTYVVALNTSKEQILSEYLPPEPNVVRGIIDTLTDADDLCGEILQGRPSVSSESVKTSSPEACPTIMSRILRRLSYIAVFGSSVSENISDVES